VCATALAKSQILNVLIRYDRFNGVKYNEILQLQYIPVWAHLKPIEE